MAKIEVKNLNFSYGADVIFSDAAFTLDTDWKTGFTGRNGRGKTTFLKLLNGDLEYDGLISCPAKTLYFPFQVEEDQSVQEVMENITAFQAEPWQMKRELKLMNANIDLSAVFAYLSKGEKTKVMLASMFLQEGEFLLIDEPTDNLDLIGRNAVAAYLNAKKGFIVVSHDAGFLDACTDHTLSINRTQIEVVKGNFSSFLSEKQARERGEDERNKQLKGEIERLKEAAKKAEQFAGRAEDKRYASGNGGEKPADRGFMGKKSAKLMSLSKNAVKRFNAAAEEKSGLLKDAERTFDLKVSPLAFHAERLVQLKDVSLFYGNKRVCENVSFEITRGEKVAITGGNGSGKSSIIKLIAGEEIKYEGELLIPKGLIISRVHQETNLLSGGLKNFCARGKIDESLFKAILNKLDFQKKDFEGDLRDFSEGQKKKVLLSASLSKRAHLYIWDEPLNYIDYYSREQIFKLITENALTLLFVEHDAGFVQKAADKIVRLV